MSDLNVTRLGQKDAAGATDALFLKVFPGEVLTAFNDANVMLDKHVVRSIQSGISAQFPATGKASARYVTPGTLVTGQQFKQNERIIYIDGELISDYFTATIDSAMAHFDIRGEIASQMGKALANKLDQHVLQVGVLTARGSATVNGGDGGAALTNAAAKTDSDILGSMIFDAAKTLDEKNVPQDERYCALRPAQYYLLAQNTKYVNNDWNRGNGDFSSAMVKKVANIPLVMTNNLPITNIAAAESGVHTSNTYHGDFSKTAGLVWHRSAFGTVKLIDLKMEKGYKMEYRGTLMIASVVTGHGILRPECGVELATP